MTRRDTDALVIGAGPAGASCAIRLARAGWDVTLIEQSVYPRGKVCGECLGAATLQLVDELGVGEQLRALAGPEIRQVGWMTHTRTAVAEMPACTTGSHRYGRAIGRDTLDTLLLECARRVGVTIIQPARVQAIRGVPGAFVCEYRRRSGEDRAEPAAAVATIFAAIVIDAHGSWELAPAGIDSERHLERSKRPSDLLAFKANFQDTALSPGFLPVLALPGGYGGMVIADRGRTTIACCLRRDTLRECRQGTRGDGAGAVVEAYLKSSCRGVARALDGARREGPWRSVGPLRLGFAASGSPGVLRIGNAAIEAHPLIGEGICMALQSAALLAGALQSKPARINERFISGCQERYERAGRRAFAWRINWAQCCAQMAMHRSLATPLAVVMQQWPRALTLAARLAGKAQSVVPPARAAGESHEYA
jgi:2-polyprenyl-6-methoxyphenol hydroxylase-like FAD-dependent oxidoreductase